MYVCVYPVCIYAYIKIYKNTYMYIDTYIFIHTYTSFFFSFIPSRTTVLGRLRDFPFQNRN